MPVFARFMGCLAAPFRPTPKITLTKNQYEMMLADIEEKEKIEKEKAELDVTISSLREANGAKDEEIAELKMNNSSQQAPNATKDEEIAELRTTILSLEAAIVNFEETNASLRAANDTKDVEIVELKKTNSSLQSMNAAKDREITKQNNLMNSLIENNKSLTKSIDEMSREVKENGRSLTKSVDMLKGNGHITETTIRARIKDMSTLSGAYRYSQSTLVAGISWRFTVCRKNDHLAIYLRGNTPNADKWPISAFFNLQLISQKNAGVVLTRGENQQINLFTNEDSYWGFDEFTSIENLYDRYVEDDSIIVAADIKIFPST